MFKTFMIPVAAFAITATSVSAFNPDLLDQIDVDLTDAQIEAFETAAEMKEAGAERSEIRTYLAEEIDEDTRQEVRAAVKEVRETTRAAVRAAVAAEDYNAFVAAAPERLLAAVENESDFDQLVEAKELKEAGDKEGARAIMDELGLEKPDHKKGKRGGDRGPRTTE